MIAQLEQQKQQYQSKSYPPKQNWQQFNAQQQQRQNLQQFGGKPKRRWQNQWNQDQCTWWEGNTSICFHCKQVGHMKRECQILQKSVQIVRPRMDAKKGN